MKPLKGIRGKYTHEVFTVNGWKLVTWRGVASGQVKDTTDDLRWRVGRYFFKPSPRFDQQTENNLSLTGTVFTFSGTISPTSFNFRSAGSKRQLSGNSDRFYCCNDRWKSTTVASMSIANHAVHADGQSGLIAGSALMVGAIRFAIGLTTYSVHTDVRSHGTYWSRCRF